MRESTAIEKHCDTAYQAPSRAEFVGAIGDAQAQIRICLQWLDHLQEVPQIPRTSFVELMTEGHELIAMTTAIIEAGGSPPPSPQFWGEQREVR